MIEPNPLLASTWVPTGWWRVVAPDGSLWCETSSEREAREAVRVGDTLQRQERVTAERWSDVRS